MTAPKIINPNDKDCPKIEYNSNNNKINTCNAQYNNELKGINAQNYKIIHSVSDSPNSSSEDCILIEDDDEEEESMLVSDSGQNKSNGYIINNDKKYSSHLDKTIELSLSSSTTTSATVLTNNKIYNNNLIKFQTSQKNNQALPLLAPPSSTSLLTSNHFISGSQKDIKVLQKREIATSTTSLDKETTSTNKSLESISLINNVSIKCNEIGTLAAAATAKANASKLANELIKRLQTSSETTKSIILNNSIKNNRLKNINCIAPTKIHRLPNPRDVASVDSLNLEMCHFKPIKTVPITPIKTPNAVIIKIPVAKKIKNRTRKCDVFIGPKKGLMPVLFSTTTSERFSAFYVYNIKNTLPVVASCQKQINKGNKLKNNTPIKPKINVKIKQQQNKLTKKNSLQLQKTTKKKFFEKTCIIKLRRCKFPPKYLKQELIKTTKSRSKTKLNTIATNCSIINKSNKKINKTQRKQVKKNIESTPSQIPKLLIISNTKKNKTNNLKRILRTNLQPINYCEKKTSQRSSKEKDIYTILPVPPNKVDNNKSIKTRSKTVVSDPYVSKDITILTTNTTETVSKKLLSSNKINDKKKTIISLRIKKNQERLDFEYAKRLQYEFLNECGPIEPIALRLRRKSVSSMSVINFDQRNYLENINSSSTTYKKNNHNINRKTGQNLIT